MRQSRQRLPRLTPSSILFDSQCPWWRCQKVGWSRLCVQLQGELDGAQPLEFLHANAEDTGLPAASADLVTLSLVAHELPTAATAAIFRCCTHLLETVSSNLPHGWLVSKTSTGWAAVSCSLWPLQVVACLAAGRRTDFCGRVACSPSWRWMPPAPSGRGSSITLQPTSPSNQRSHGCLSDSFSRTEAIWCRANFVPLSILKINVGLRTTRYAMRKTCTYTCWHPMLSLTEIRLIMLQVCDLRYASGNAGGWVLAATHRAQHAPTQDSRCGQATVTLEARVAAAPVVVLQILLQCQL